MDNIIFNHKRSSLNYVFFIKFIVQVYIYQLSQFPKKTSAKNSHPRKKNINIPLLMYSSYATYLICNEL